MDKWDKWYDYKLTVATKHDTTHVQFYSGITDDDAIDRACVKRLTMEDKYGEIVAYQIESCRTYLPQSSCLSCGPQ